MEFFAYKKCWLLTGKTYPHKEEIKKLGGSWNPFLKGWVFRRSNKAAVQAWLVEKLVDELADEVGKKCAVDSDSDSDLSWIDRAVDDFPPSGGLGAATTETVATETIPNEYYCPIGKDIMRDPVMAEDNHTYDRENIEKWFDGGHKMSPLTGETLRNLELRPNTSLRSLIDVIRPDRDPLPLPSESSYDPSSLKTADDRFVSPKKIPYRYSCKCGEILRLKKGATWRKRRNGSKCSKCGTTITEEYLARLKNAGK